MGQPTDSRLILIVQGLIPLILAALLWIIAPTIGRLICHGNNTEGVITSISFYQSVVAMFVGLGTYFCLSSFGGIFNWLHFLFVEQTAPHAMPYGIMNSYYSLAKEALTFAAGLFCIFTAKRWAHKLSNE